MASPMRRRLRLSKSPPRHPEPDDFGSSDSEDRIPHRRSSGAERTRKWRESKLSGPDAEEFRKHERESARKRRKSAKDLTESQLDEQRAKGRERARKFREKAKALGIPIKHPTLTRKQREKLRTYNRLKQRESRKRRSRKEHEKIKKYDRDRHALKTISAKRYGNDEGLQVDFLTSSSVRKHSRRIRRKMPKNPSKFVAVLDHIVRQAKKSPRKRLLLEADKGDEPERKRRKLGTEFLKKLKTIKGQEKAQYVKDICRKYKSRREVARKFGLQWKVLQKACSLAQIDKEMRRSASEQKVTTFYTRPDVSINLPEAKHAGKKYMSTTLQQAHKMFISNHENPRVPFSTFAKLKPKQVKTMGHTPNRQCICEVCANFELLIKGLTKTGISTVPKDGRRAVDDSMCEKSSNHMHLIECVQRSCKKRNCGTKHIERAIRTSPNYEKSRNVEWNRWANVETPKGKKMLMTVIQGTLDQLIEMYIDDLDRMALHLFNADWHYRQFRNLTAEVPENVVVQVLDFAQNYLCYYQDEPQSVHWDHSQVTIHPIVTFYRCTCGGIVTEDLVFITSDLKHDAHAVREFTGIALEHVDKKIDRHLLVQFTDRCAAQYCSKVPFSMLAEMPNTVRIFYGARHGKSSADGVTGRVKQAVTRAVKARKYIVNDAKSFFDFCKVELETQTKQECQHHQMHFFHVEDIDRTFATEAATITGTRQIHCVRSCTDSRVIESRKVACVCEKCLGQGSTRLTCPNREWVDDWKKETTMKRKRDSSTPIPRKTRKMDNSVKDETEEEKKGEGTRTNRKRNSNPSAPCRTRKTDNTSKLSKTTIKHCTTSETPNQNKDQPATLRRSQRVLALTDGIERQKTRLRATREIEMPNMREDTKLENTKRTISAGARSSKKTEERTPTPKAEVPTSRSTSKKTVIHPTKESVLKPKKQTTTSKKYLPRSVVQKKTRTPWSKILVGLQHCRTFSDMEAYVQSHEGQPLPELKEQTLLTTRGTVDKIALKTLPSDVEEGLLPVMIYGDGNCFPRTLSTLVYGNGFHFDEMRARVVYEGVVNKEMYLNHSYLSKGAIQKHKKAALPMVYAQYADEYIAGEVLSPSAIERVYEVELQSVVQRGSYCGIWQIFFAANVLGCRIYSHYPVNTNKSIRNDLNRIIYPIVPSTLPTLHIMWSAFKAGGAPNHFVPLLPMTMRKIESAEKDSLIEEEEQEQSTSELEVSLSPKHLAAPAPDLESVGSSLHVPAEVESVGSSLQVPAEFEHCVDPTHLAPGLESVGSSLHVPAEAEDCVDPTHMAPDLESVGSSLPENRVPADLESVGSSLPEHRVPADLESVGSSLPEHRVPADLESVGSSLHVPAEAEDRVDPTHMAPDLESVGSSLPGHRVPAEAEDCAGTADLVPDCEPPGASLSIKPGSSEVPESLSIDDHDWFTRAWNSTRVQDSPTIDDMLKPKSSKVPDSPTNDNMSTRVWNYTPAEDSPTIDDMLKPKCKDIPIIDDDMFARTRRRIFCPEVKCTSRPTRHRVKPKRLDL